MRGRILAARLDGTALFPLVLRIRRPDSATLGPCFDQVRGWIKALEDGNKARHGFGYEIEWNEINHRQLGRNRLPVGIRVTTEYDALRLIGKLHQAERFSVLADATLRHFPTLIDWLARNSLKALDHAEEWNRVLAILTWFREHPRPGMYLRQIDIPGVHTKFIELHKGVLSELLNQVLPPEGVDTSFTPGKGFEQRYGLASEPPLVRFRILDRRLAIRGLCDIAVPAADFARLDIPVERVFITENKTNGLAFPDLDNSLVVFGLGHGFGVLADAGWLQTKAVYYWGDLDTHGFAILDRLRAAFPSARSFLMDGATLEAHRAFWVQESSPYMGSLERLSGPEQDVFDALRRDLLGQRVRLEQERIAFGWLKRSLQALP